MLVHSPDKNRDLLGRADDRGRLDPKGGGRGRHHPDPHRVFVACGLHLERESHVVNYGPYLEALCRAEPKDHHVAPFHDPANERRRHARRLCRNSHRYARRHVHLNVIGRRWIGALPRKPELRAVIALECEHTAGLKPGLGRVPHLPPPHLTGDGEVRINLYSVPLHLVLPFFIHHAKAKDARFLPHPAYARETCLIWPYSKYAA
ncbi:MAG: hypothetical protein QF473_15740 [Planctomycetota bacterium]|nr:hypothetical protein [Planctomycetota bacterium]